MSSTISEQVLELEVTETDLDQPDEILRTKEFNITSFLIEHGSKIVSGHDGQPVTVAEAYDNCDAFRRLVHAMGERALFLSAARLPEEQIEEDTEEADKTEKIGDGLEEQPGAEKPAQKSGGIERAEQRITKKEAVDVPDVIKEIAGQEAVTPAKVASANKFLGDKPGISQAGETSSEPPPAAVSGTSPQKVKAETFSIPEMSQNIVKAADPTTKADSPRGDKSAVITQEAAALTFPELAKNSYVGGDEEIREMRDITSPPEAKDDVSLIDQRRELFFAEDEEHQIIPAEAGGDFFLEEIADSEAELFLESELIGVDGWWANNEVVRLRDLGADEEVRATSVLFAEINNTGTAEDLPTEEVEQTVIELVEKIEAIDTEEAEMVHEILDKIALKVESIVAPLQVAESGQENDESGQVKLEVGEIGAKQEEELRGLFMELFDYVGMEYSSELIEAITKLALKIDIWELIPKTEMMEKPIPNPSQGTHEIIKQLLGALTAIKQVAERAYAIGKSVLLLYRHQLASA